jgi:hypothetical protein
MDSRSITLAEEKDIGTSVTPSPRESLNKERKAEQDNTTTENEGSSIQNVPAASGEEDDEGEYPDATRMTFIVIALLLSIFLVISPPPPPNGFLGFQY